MAYDYDYNNDKGHSTQPGHVPDQLTGSISWPLLFPQFFSHIAFFQFPLKVTMEPACTMSAGSVSRFQQHSAFKKYIFLMPLLISFCFMCDL